MPRFVLLYHDCPLISERPSHWDFMLESGDALRTWAIEWLPRNWQAAHSRTAAIHSSCPVLGAENCVAALQLADHRRDYLQLEGQLMGNRGTVVRVAAGTYRSETESPGYWRIALADTELVGRITLTRLSPDSSQWTLECRTKP